MAIQKRQPLTHRGGRARQDWRGWWHSVEFAAAWAWLSNHGNGVISKSSFAVVHSKLRRTAWRVQDNL